MSAPANSALDDARKRARRRLLGAIVLALIAAVVVPLFLESDPKPLGSDVQIQIPPIDDAKFQNRLTPPAKGTEGNGKPADVAGKGDGGKASADSGRAATSIFPKDGTPKTSGNADDASAAVADAKSSERRVDGGSDAKVADQKADGSDAKVLDKKVDAGSDAKLVDKKADSGADPKNAGKKGDGDANVASRKGDAGNDAKADAKADAKLAPKTQKDARTAEARAAAPAGPTSTSGSRPPNAGSQTLNTAPPAGKGGPEYVVQLGAYVDKAVAMDLAARAGGHGFSVFLEAVTTKNGTVQRVRVGPFASRQAADEAAARLSKAGFTAVATTR